MGRNAQRRRAAKAAGRASAAEAKANAGRVAPEEEASGPDYAKLPAFNEALAVLGRTAGIARDLAQAELAAYAAATAMSEEVFCLPVGSLSRLVAEFQAGDAALRAQRVRLLFGMFGPTCPGMGEVHADGSIGDCSEDDCPGGFHLESYECGWGGSWCDDCAIHFGFDEDEDDAEPNPALASALARIDECFGARRRRTGTDG